MIRPIFKTHKSESGKTGRLVLVSNLILSFLLIFLFVREFISEAISEVKSEKKSEAKSEDKMAKENAVNSPEFFIEIKVSNPSPHLMQAFSVEYWLYSSVEYVRSEVTLFPKYSHVLKRFLMEEVPEDRVEYKNKIYWRHRKYKAILFPLASTPIQLGKLALKVITWKGPVEVASPDKRLVVVKDPKFLLPYPLVGNHTLDIVSKNLLCRSGESFEIDVRISGEGALEFFRESDLHWQDEIKKKFRKFRYEGMEGMNKTKILTYRAQCPEQKKAFQLAAFINVYEIKGNYDRNAQYKKLESKSHSMEVVTLQKSAGEGGK